VAAHLAKYRFTLKTSPPSPYKPGDENAVPQELSFQPLEDSREWETGVIYAEAQNLARTVPIVSFGLEVAPLIRMLILAERAPCKYVDSDRKLIMS
jgi:hypothetical protein